MSSKIKVSLKGGGDRIAATTDVVGGKTISPPTNKPSTWNPFLEDLRTESNKHYYVTPLNNIDSYRNHPDRASSGMTHSDLCSTNLFPDENGNVSIYNPRKPYHEFPRRSNWVVHESTISDLTAVTGKYSVVNLYNGSTKTTLANSWSTISEPFTFRVIDEPMQHGANLLYINYVLNTTMGAGGIIIMPIDDPYHVQFYRFFTARNTEVLHYKMHVYNGSRDDMFNEYRNAMSNYRGRYITPADKNTHFIIFGRKDLGFNNPVDGNWNMLFGRGTQKWNFGFSPIANRTDGRAVWFRLKEKYNEISYPKAAILYPASGSAKLHPNDSGMVRTYQQNGTTVDYATYNGTQVPIVGRLKEGMELPGDRIYAVEQGHFRFAPPLSLNSYNTFTVGVVSEKLDNGRIRLWPTIRSSNSAGFPVSSTYVTDPPGLAKNIASTYPNFMPLIFDVTDHMHIFQKPHDVDAYLPHLKKFYKPMFPNKPNRLGDNVLIADPTRPEDFTIRPLPAGEDIWVVDGNVNKITSVSSTGSATIRTNISGNYHLFFEVTAKNTPSFAHNREIYGIGNAHRAGMWVAPGNHTLHLYDNRENRQGGALPVLPPGDVITVRVIVHKYDSNGVSSYFEKTLTVNVTA